MELDKIKDGKRVRYAIKWRAGVSEGTGKVIQTYQTQTGHRVVVHDKANNRTVTARPTQLKAA